MEITCHGSNIIDNTEEYKIVTELWRVQDCFTIVKGGITQKLRKGGSNFCIELNVLTNWCLQGEHKTHFSVVMCRSRQVDPLSIAPAQTMRDLSS